MSIVTSSDELILYALEAKAGRSKGTSTIVNTQTGEGLYDQADEVGIKPMYPSCFYTLDGSDSTRIYAASPHYLLHHPANIFGRSAEVVIFDHEKNQLKWQGYRQRRMLPKTVFTMRRYSYVYEHHQRIISTKGEILYQVRLFPLDRNGIPVPCRYQKHSMLGDVTGFYIHASAIEDTYRANAVVATLKNEKTLIMPVSYDSYLSLFRLRGDPRTKSGKLKALKHWVKQHTRKLRTGRTTEIKRHQRGIANFDIEDYSVTLDLRGHGLMTHRGR